MLFGLVDVAVAGAATIPRTSHASNTMWTTSQSGFLAATLKTELVYREARTTIPVARSAVFENIEVFYNPKRLHSTLGYQSPSTYEACRLIQSETASAA